MCRHDPVSVQPCCHRRSGSCQRTNTRKWINDTVCAWSHATNLLFAAPKTRVFVATPGTSSSSKSNTINPADGHCRMRFQRRELLVKHSGHATSVCVGPDHCLTTSANERVVLTHMCKHQLSVSVVSNCWPHWLHWCRPCTTHCKASLICVSIPPNDATLNHSEHKVDCTELCTVAHT